MAHKKSLKCKLGMHAWGPFEYYHLYGNEIVDYCEQGRWCKDCGEIESVRLGLHEWGDWAYRTGLRERKCKRCGQSQTRYDYEDIVADVHDDWNQS